MTDIMRRRVREFLKDLRNDKALDQEAALYVEHLNYQSRDIDTVTHTNDGGHAYVNHEDSNER